ncbi:MAG: hypothetical protein KGO96_00010 [Elusimicrobia bacterium]|nr:hypothetical protein [Elusimicrobiota bacterium]MDE2238206.1 hypothetical protein [Elusimicrobiota bacterium]MDE2424276.1 hypothetical protein [Elusimicrobiota bacterium]
MHDDDPLSRRLRALPGHRAPATLLPGVLAAVRRPAPWWSRPWWSWPIAARAAYGLAVCAAGGLALRGGLAIASPGLAVLGAAQQAVGALWALALSPWGWAGQPLQLLVFATAACCGGLAAGLARLALPELAAR